MKFDKKIKPFQWLQRFFCCSTVKDPNSMGADAIVNIRYASAAVMNGAAEVMAYGTAVKFK